jgi:hypothetical protein
MMNCRTALQILDCMSAAGMSDLPAAEVAAAEEHVADCRRCAAVVRSRQKLDRRIGRILRAVEVPRDAQCRLLEKVAVLEASRQAAEPASAISGRIESTVGIGPSQNGGLGAMATALRGHAPDMPIQSDGHGTHQFTVDGPVGILGSAAPASENLRPAEPVSAPIPHELPGRTLRSRRRVMTRLVPAAACLAVAIVGFFGAVWLLTPRWTVDDIRIQLAAIDFETLQALPKFHGATVAASLPADAAWQNLGWYGDQVPRSLSGPSGRHAVAVYGFRFRDKRHRWIGGLLAIAQRSCVPNPPTELSIAYAPNPEYVSAKIGESVSVAWTSGDVVCVCLVQGGPDSLALLQDLLSAPAA